MRPLHVLLGGVVDYAGLFPPAALDMRRAVRSYATYRQGPLAWMLGRFVVPVARLAEFEDAAEPLLPRGPGAAPWRLSAIAGHDVEADLERFAAVRARRANDADTGRAVIDGLEVKAPTPEVISRTGALVSSFGLRVAYEVPLDRSLAESIAAVSAAGGIAKVRLGGMTPHQVPPIEAVAEWLWLCASASLPAKATAGLHHPVRGTYPLTYEPDALRSVMHGFVNVLVAACVAHSAARRGRDPSSRPPVLDALLAETDPAAFWVSTDAVGWRDSVLDAEAIDRARAGLVLSIGSCSFEEPVDELRSLGFPL